MARGAPCGTVKAHHGKDLTMLAHDFDTRNDPPRTEPILLAAAAFIAAVALICALLVAAA